MGEDVDIGGEVWSSLWQLSLLDNKCLYCASASVGDYSQVHPRRSGNLTILIITQWIKLWWLRLSHELDIQSLCIWYNICNPYVYNEIYTILLYTYLNPKCGDVSMEYWGCAKTHFLEHIDKSKRFEKGETFQFFIRFKKIYCSATNRFRIQVGNFVKTNRPLWCTFSWNLLGCQWYWPLIWLNFLFLYFVEKKYNKTNEPMGANITGLHLVKLSSRCFLL